MNCCCPHAKSAGKFFSLFARRYRKRFEKRGFETSQQQLMAGLERAGYQDATLLEIGSGVGHLHQTLLEQGARSATGIDLAPNMIAEARVWARERNLSERTEYYEGDYMALADQLSAADVTLLDKVVCCYPDAEGLIKQSLRNTRCVYALSYPRNRWFIHLGAAIGSFFMWLLRSAFRPYVHDPELIGQIITDGNFELLYQNQTTIWLTQVYVNKDRMQH